MANNPSLQETSLSVHSNEKVIDAITEKVQLICTPHRIGKESSNQFNSKLNSNDEEEQKLAKSFPWLTQFVKLCRAEIGVTDINTLENLMTVYLKHIGSTAVECYVKPNRAAKLKRCMNNTMVLFHMLYSDIKKPLEHSSYLDKMSNLLAYYIDLEIKASRRGKESIPKIASKLTSSLYLFLDHSVDHILDAILKTKYMTKNFNELCSFIFKRVLKEGLGRTVYEMTYVRYILVFKMWKRVVKGVEERRKVMKLAATRLIPPLQFREKLKSGLLSGVLPKIPKSRPDITMFLMQAKFCVKEKSKAFLKVVADPKQQCALGTSLSADLDRPLFFGDGADSPHNSNSDDQEDTSGSSMLMNDIWSSMTLEAGLRDHLRLATVTVTKTKKNSKNKMKKKNKKKCDENTSVTDKSKKKNKKKIKKAEGKSGESECNTSQTRTAEKEKLLDADTKPPIVQCSAVESCTQTVGGSIESTTPLIPIENIKVEADSSDDVCFMGILRKDGDDLIDGTSISSDRDTEMLDVAREIEVSDTDSVKMERPGTALTFPTSSSHPLDVSLHEQQHPTEWSPAPTQNYFNNAVCDFIYGTPDFDMDTTTSKLNHRTIYDVTDTAISLQSKHIDEELRSKDIIEDNTPLTLSENNLVVASEKLALTNDTSSSYITYESDILQSQANCKYSCSQIDAASNSLTSDNPSNKLTENAIPSKKNINLKTPAQLKEFAVSSNVYSGVEEDHPISEVSEQAAESGSGKVNEQLKNESLKEQDRCSRENPEPNIVSNCEADANNELESKAKKKGPFHDNTLVNDHSIFISQQQFRSMYITEVLPPTIPVPSPPKMDSSSRCKCDQCNANYEALKTNYEKLTAFRDSKLNSACKKSQGSEDSLPGKDPKKEHHSSLPLKKRKAVQSPTLLKKEANETSYPCTPMMSIAVALENSKVGMQMSTTLATKPLTTSVAVVDFTPSAGTQHYSYSSVVSSSSPTAPSNLDSTGYDNQNHKYPCPNNNLVSNSLTSAVSKNNKSNNVPSSVFQLSVKTPAQLKEGLTVPSNDLNAAQDLINFAQNSQNYYTHVQGAQQTIKSNKRTRSKTKSERNVSKRRKN